MTLAVKDHPFFLKMIWKHTPASEIVHGIGKMLYRNQFHISDMYKGFHIIIGNHEPPDALLSPFHDDGQALSDPMDTAVQSQLSQETDGRFFVNWNIIETGHNGRCDGKIKCGSCLSDVGRR